MAKSPFLQESDFCPSIRPIHHLSKSSKMEEEMVEMVVKEELVATVNPENWESLLEMERTAESEAMVVMAVMVVRWCYSFILLLLILTRVSRY